MRITRATTATALAAAAGLALTACGGGSGAGGGDAPAGAPDGPVTMIVPFSAGGVPTSPGAPSRRAWRR